MTIIKYDKMTDFIISLFMIVDVLKNTAKKNNDKKLDKFVGDFIIKSYIKINYI